MNRSERICQGNIYWIHPGKDVPEELGTHSHPYAVIQADVLNWSRINTIVVCALSSNLKLASEPGNVLLEPHEGGLPRQSVAVVSKVSSVAKSALGEYIGHLDTTRVEQILTGMRFQQRTYFLKNSSP